MDINKYISSGIIEQYVMGLCSAEEAKELEELRRQYPELNEAIIQYEKELEERMQKNSVLPPAATDEKILQVIDTLKDPRSLAAGSAKIRKMSWLRAVAAAAILLLAVSITLNYILYTKTKKQKEELTATDNKENGATLPLADYNIMKNPAITPVALYGVGTHAICRCTMFWDKKTGKAYIMIHHLIPSSPNKDYQLWAIVDGKPVSAGIVNDDIRGRFIEINNIPANATAFTVTLENAGGSDSPTVEETYLRGEI